VKKPIFTVAHIMTSVARGGLELYVAELIGRLHRAGVKQIVVCDEHAAIVEELRREKIVMEFFPRGSRYSFSRMLRLRAIHKKYAVSLWHSHQRDDMVLTALAYFFKKIRHIFSLYMGFAHKKDLLHRLVYARLEKLVTTSEVMNDLARERLPVRKDQLELIRYGRDIKKFQVDALQIARAKKNANLKGKNRLVVSLCRLDPMKGVREFVDAARIMDNKFRGKFLFLQVGERTIVGYNAENRPIYFTESEDVYHQLVAAERGARESRRFKLLPFQKDYASYLAAADYFVLASYDEMYSLSVIDAMLSGAVVIGTDNGGTVEQLSDGRGFLIAAKSGIAIAEAIERAEKQPQAREKMRKAALTWARREHSWQTVLPQWLDAYGASRDLMRNEVT